MNSKEKKSICSICRTAGIVALALFLANAAFGQSLSRRPSLSRPRLLHREFDETLILESLPSFAEAVDLAKSGNPRGWYALAIHYCSGETINKDESRAYDCLVKAVDSAYGNALLIYTMLQEEKVINEHIDKLLLPEQ